MSNRTNKPRPRGKKFPDGFANRNGPAGGQSRKNRRAGTKSRKKYA